MNGWVVAPELPLKSSSLFGILSIYYVVIDEDAILVEVIIIVWCPDARRCMTATYIRGQPLYDH